MDYTDEQVARVYTEARRARAMLPGHPEIAFDWVQLPADAREQLMRSVSTFRERQHSNVFGHDPLFGAIVRALTPKMTGPGCKIGTFYVDIVPRADVGDTRSYGEEAAQVILDALSPDDGKTAFKPAAGNMVDTCGYRLIEVRCPACERCVAVHSGDFTGLDFTPKSLDRAVAAKAERNCPGLAGEHGPVCIGTFPHEHPAEARPETRGATDRVADDAEPLSAGSATAPAGAGYVHAAPQKIATVYVDVAPELGHFRYDLAAGLRDIADDIDRPRAGHRADVAENVMSADEARARYGRPARPLRKVPLHQPQFGDRVHYADYSHRCQPAIVLAGRAECVTLACEGSPSLTFTSFGPGTYTGGPRTAQPGEPLPLVTCADQTFEAGTWHWAAS